MKYPNSRLGAFLDISGDEKVLKKVLSGKAAPPRPKSLPFYILFLTKLPFHILTVEQDTSFIYQQ